MPGALDWRHCLSFPSSADFGGQKVGIYEDKDWEWKDQKSWEEKTQARDHYCQEAYYSAKGEGTICAQKQTSSGGRSFFSYGRNWTKWNDNPIHKMALETISKNVPF